MLGQLSVLYKLAIPRVLSQRQIISQVKHIIHVCLCHILTLRLKDWLVLEGQYYHI